MSLIKRAQEYCTDYKNKTGKFPEGPFFVYESEWEEFLASDDALREVPNAIFEADVEAKFRIANMTIYIIRETDDNTV